MNQPTTVDEYIASAPQAAQNHLKSLRQLVRQTAPQATEKLSYGMPYYSLNGRLLYFGGFKTHVSLYPMKSGINNFEKELSDYHTSAGTVQFPLDQPLPTELINKIIKFRVQENLIKGK